jgi:hypothetical protein
MKQISHKIEKRRILMHLNQPVVPRARAPHAPLRVHTLRATCVVAVSVMPSVEGRRRGDALGRALEVGLGSVTWAEYVVYVYARAPRRTGSVFS